MNKHYTIFVISNKPESFPSIVNSLKPERVNYFDGSGYESFSKLVNSCTEMCPTEIVIMLSHKVLPTSEQVQKLVGLLASGYAFVGLCNFRFFGFKKELFRKIGMFDERFIGGGFEDYDYIARLIESRLAFYLTEEVPYFYSPSSWADSNSNYSGGDFWLRKWRHIYEEGNDWRNGSETIPKKLERWIDEERYDYNLGSSVHTNFLPLDEHTIISDPSLAAFLKMNIDFRPPSFNG